MDYKQIIESLEEEKIIKLMYSLGADRHEDKGDFIVFPTICHNESATDASMKLYYYKDNKFFMCYTEDGGMSIFKFLERYYQTRGIEFNWYNDVLQVVLNCTPTKTIDGFEPIHYDKLKDKFRKREIRKDLPIYSKKVLDVFVKRYPFEWLTDGITKQAMDKFGIKFSISQNKIIIPHFDVNNNLIGIRGRALNDWEVENVGKYMPVQIEKTWYNHPLSLNLYGLNVTKNNIQKNGVCYLFEAEKSVLQVDDFEMDNCAAAVCGSQFNKFQLNLLMKTCYPKEIVLCFDKEELPGEDKYFNKLYSICERYKNYCNFSFVYDREKLLELKDSPSDKGEEVFRKLIEKRVRVK